MGNLGRLGINILVAVVPVVIKHIIENKKQRGDR